MHHRDSNPRSTLPETHIFETLHQQSPIQLHVRCSEIDKLLLTLYHLILSLSLPKLITSFRVGGARRGVPVGVAYRSLTWPYIECTCMVYNLICNSISKPYGVFITAMVFSFKKSSLDSRECLGSCDNRKRPRNNFSLSYYSVVGPRDPFSY